MSYIFQEYKIPNPTQAYKFLIQELGLSMAQSQSFINKGRVQYEGKILGNNEKNKILKNSVNIMIFKSQSIGIKPIYENDDFAVFNKPAKMLIHPKGRFVHHSLLDEIYAYCGTQSSLIHRIDKETSGLVLVGKDSKRARELGKILANRQIHKEYLALVKGKMAIPYPFGFTLPLALQPKGGDLSVRSVYLWQNSSIKSHTKTLRFKTAQSEFEVLGFLQGNTLLKAAPISGRTHQLRLHLLALGHSILGDPLYGCLDCHSREYLDSELIRQGKTLGLDEVKRKEYFGASRLMLHAYKLQFCFEGVEYCFSAPFEIKESEISESKEIKTCQVTPKQNEDLDLIGEM